MKRITISVCLIVFALFPSCKTAMRAAEDPATGQIIISDGDKPVLQYNYSTVYRERCGGYHAGK